MIARAEEKRLVEEAVVEKKLVVVALVPVAFMKVRFWSVEEPFESRVPKVPRPLEVKLPPLPVVKNRLVELAVVLKKLVEVELPVIIRLASIVEEAVERKPLRKPRVVEVETP